MDQWDSHDPQAPEEWAFHNFPLESEEQEELSLESVTEVGLERVALARETGHRPYIGPVVHWAHILKVEQGPNGDWPAVINARTGQPVGERRTRRPAELLNALGEMLDSTEFDAAVRRAKGDVDD